MRKRFLFSSRRNGVFQNGSIMSTMCEYSFSVNMTFDMIIYLNISFLIVLISSLCITWTEASITSPPFLKSASTPPPNIVVFLSDDIGWDDLSLRGSADVLTPNLDVLAMDGIILNQYYASPLCTPSRGAFLSGVHPITSGDQHFVLLNGEPREAAAGFPLLPQILKLRANYSTHLVGKWNMGFAKKEYTPKQRGFDSFYGFYGAKIDYFTHESESMKELGYDWRDNEYVDRNGTGEYATFMLADRAIELITNHPTDDKNPMYLQVTFPNTHVGNSREPHQAPAEYVERVSGYVENSKKQIYAANLLSMDESIGRIMKTLADKDMLQNSIILFMSDNGSGERGPFPNGGSNFPLRGTKGSLWEGGIRVPAFVWSPMLGKKASIYPGLFHVSDWFPTLIHAVTGIEEIVHQHVYGMSHWNQLVEGGRSPRRFMLHNHDPIDNVLSLRTGNFKYLKGTINPEQSTWPKEPRTNLRASSRFFEQVRLHVERDYSDARKAINSIGREGSSKYHVDQLDCSIEDHDNNCSFKGCLFDIQKDPCEKHNLLSNSTFMDSNPGIMREVDQLLKYHENIAILPRNLPIDPKSAPVLHGGCWVSWKDGEQPCVSPYPLSPPSPSSSPDTSTSSS